MAFGMPVGMKSAPKKKMPQGDTGSKAKVPKTKPDDDATGKMAKNLTTPNLPDGDGPARDKIDGGMPKKPPTSAKIPKKTLMSMKSSLSGMGKF